MTSKLLPSARYAGAFRAHRLDPLEVARRALDAMQDVDALVPAMRPFITYSGPDVERQAQQSAARYAHDAPLGSLDGVPVAVKDNFDAAGYRTTGGTDLLGRHFTGKDAAVVTRLKKAGALILGKSNMHELGLGATGINPHHGACRNPHDPARAAGGSSSGSAAAIAMGLCPLAIGSDTAGSIRIPASLCGVVGFKPTFGRISVAGMLPLAWSLDSVGVMGVSVMDVATLFGALQGPDDADPSTLGLPATGTPDASASVQGVRIGLDEAFMKDADVDVVRSVVHASDALRDQGAEIVPVEIPYPKLHKPACMAIMFAEAAAAHESMVRESLDVIGPDARLALAAGRAMSATRYLQAQRARTLIQRGIQALLSNVDVLLLPTTGIAAPVIEADALSSGEVDETVNDALARFTLLASLCGLPAVSVPGRPNALGLPTGVQVVGRAFEEERVLKVAAAVEEWSGPDQKTARIFFDVLQ